MTFDQGRGDGEVLSVRVGPYATMQQGRLACDAWAAYGFHRNQQSRAVQFGSIDRRADSEYNAHEGTAYFGGQYDFPVLGLTVSPTASAQYVYQFEEGFSETGADSLNLRVNSASFHSLRTRAGLRVSRAFERDDFVITPEFSAGWAREHLDGPTITSRLSGGSTSFNTSASVPERNSAYVGAGVSMRMGERLSASLRYESEFSSRICDHWLGLELGYRF
jgi:outer membrane autotransporter protein